MIAALDTATPPTVLGWSHKYREVLAEFGLEQSALPLQDLHPETLVHYIIKELELAPDKSKKILALLPNIRKQSSAQISFAFKKIGLL